jgi:HD superfamily phosphodiesterase
MFKIQNKIKRKDELNLENLWREAEKQLGKRDYANNWVHGVPHIVRVYKNMEMLLRYCNIDKRITKCLKVTVIMHDAGRGLPGNHAENSAKIFNEMKVKGLTEKEKEEILFAVKNHSQGLAGIGIKKAKKDKEIVLGLLVLADHMDALGKISLDRVIQWSKNTGANLDLLSKIEPKKLRKFIADKKTISKIKRLNLKEESITAHLIYNYLATEQIIKPISHLLSKKFLLEIKRREEELLYEIEARIKLMEENNERLK